MHGGATPVALALPQTRSGRYSKYLPNRLLERYHQAVDDGELLVLREEIALLDARLADLLARVDTGESGGLWAKMGEAWQAVCQSRGEPVLFTAAVISMGNLIEQGNTDYAAWGEIQSLVQQRRKLVESERKRLVELQQVITVNQAMLLISSLTDILKRHVTDRAQLAAISTELIQLTAHNAGGVADPAHR